MEHEVSYQTADSHDRAVICLVLSKALKIPADKLSRIFEVGNPTFIIRDDYKSFRIHPEHADLVRMLIREYG